MLPQSKWRREARSCSPQALRAVKQADLAEPASSPWCALLTYLRQQFGARPHLPTVVGRAGLSSFVLGPVVYRVGVTAVRGCAGPLGCGLSPGVSRVRMSRFPRSLEARRSAKPDDRIVPAVLPIVAGVKTRVSPASAVAPDAVKPPSRTVTAPITMVARMGDGWMTLPFRGRRC